MDGLQLEKPKRTRHIKTADLVSAENEYHKALGLKIKELRESAGLKQKDVADALGVHQSSIAMLEIGKIKSMYRIRQVFEAIGYELTYTEKKTPYLLN